MKISYIENKIYDKTNNIYSLWLAREYLNEDTLLLEGDMFFEKKIIDLLLSNKSENSMVVDHFMPLLNGTVVEINKSNLVTGIYLKDDQKPYKDFDYTNKFKTVNIYKLSKNFLQCKFVPVLKKFIEDGEVNSFYEKILKQVFDNGGIELSVAIVKGHRWFEIDTLDELKMAEEVFSW